jgi:hypothetical protein
VRGWPILLTGQTESNQAFLPRALYAMAMITITTMMMIAQYKFLRPKNAPKF